MLKVGQDAGTGAVSGVNTSEYADGMPKYVKYSKEVIYVRQSGISSRADRNVSPLRTMHGMMEGSEWQGCKRKERAVAFDRDKSTLCNL